ncbi:MAG: hemolysin III family protein [Clostridia bacterium]|nr:hemolysin III family protein [Clostridia bacterium]
MARTRLRDRQLPSYTKGEEIFNMVTHIVGGAMGITATVLCVVFAALHHNVYGVVSGALFGAMMIILYTMSSIYHGLRPNMAKKVFQIFDHCSIFLLIAGTYTPFALCVLRQHSLALGWSIFGVIWGLAALGIVLKAIDIKMFEVISFILYVGMGWCIVFTAKIVYGIIGSTGFGLLLSGGIAYTVGAVMYCFTSKLRYIHSIFHIFVVIGSLLHFLCILLFIM